MTVQNNDFYSGIPASMPRTHHPLLSRWARRVFAWLGWRFEGEVPDLAKAVIIIAPHTSNWDFFIACIAKFALDVKVNYLMKREAFFWPFKNWLIGIGGIPVDRSQPATMVDEIGQCFHEKDKLWLVITPEGTRKKVSRYKTGFLRIACSAQVPVVVVGLDFKRKAIVFAKVVEATGQHEQDADALYHYCRETFVGRNPQNQ